MQVCTSLQTDNHASTPPLSFFTGRMPFLLPNQQRQSTEGTIIQLVNRSKFVTVKNLILKILINVTPLSADYKLDHHCL